MEELLRGRVSTLRILIMLIFTCSLYPKWHEQKKWAVEC